MSALENWLRLPQKQRDDLLVLLEANYIDFQRHDAQAMCCALVRAMDVLRAPEAGDADGGSK